MLSVAAVLALAQVSNDWKLYGTTAFGKAIVPFLGSEDPRSHWTLGVQAAKPEPRFRFKKLRADLFVEAYYEDSSSPGASQQPPNQTDAAGVLFGARYRFGSGFFDLGWGLQYTDQRSVDISSRLSSTPNATIGFFFDIKGREYLAGLRFVHISNAGLSGNNQGTNQIGFFFAVRF